MLIAVHKRDGGFAKEWISFCKKKELEYIKNGGILPYVLKQICNEENSQNYDNL